MSQVPYTNVGPRDPEELIRPVHRSRCSIFEEFSYKQQISDWDLLKKIKCTQSQTIRKRRKLD